MLCYVRLCYVCNHVYIYVSWKYSCWESQFYLLLFCGKNGSVLTTKTVTFLYKKLKDVNISSVLCFNIKEFSVTKCWFLPKRELCP